MEPYELGLTDAAAAIAAKELSPVELTESVLARIEAVEPALNAFATVTADLALDAAKRASDEIVAGGYRGPLHGISLGVKDLYDTAGVATTASSRVRADHVPTADATVVARLLAAGMIMVGKTHTHEFAFGGITPTTRNPWNTGHIPGGSSGGSGAAVASGECLIGLGSDTGGSIRMPAGACGVTGLKPTYGLVSRRGVASLSWSLDHVGPLARTVRDTALVLDVIAGYERDDPATMRALGEGAYAAGLDAGRGEGLAGRVIGVPTNLFFDRVDAEVEAAVRAAIDTLVGLGAQAVDFTVPMAEAIPAAAQVIVKAEAAAYHRTMMRDRGELYTDQVRTNLQTGELILATDYIDALRVRTLVQRAWADAVTAAGIDVIIAPTSPVPAPPVELGERTWPDGTTEDLRRAIGRYSSPANLTGLPALAVPVGLAADGMPLSMQIIGRPFGEPTVLAVGMAYERATDWSLPVSPR